MFAPAVFLDLVRNFVVFTRERTGLVKRVAKYHQFHAVNKDTGFEEVTQRHPLMSRLTAAAWVWFCFRSHPSHTRGVRWPPGRNDHKGPLARDMWVASAGQGL